MLRYSAIDLLYLQKRIEPIVQSYYNAEDGTWTHTTAIATRSLVLLVCQFRHFRVYLIATWSISSRNSYIIPNYLRNFNYRFYFLHLLFFTSFCKNENRMAQHIFTSISIQKTMQNSLSYCSTWFIFVLIKYIYFINWSNIFMLKFYHSIYNSICSAIIF